MISHHGAIDLPGPAREEIALGEVLHALSDPIRRQIVVVLDAADAEVACGEFQIGVSKSTASHHFKVLREAGVLVGRYEGTRRFHSLRRADLDARFPGLLDSVLCAARPDAAAQADASPERTA